ncbi:hypothetical protein MMC14_009676 [Varicellaria rhodocarpa]|nr:hypothetical protein [Varicellaria rhodocarpa]
MAWDDTYINDTELQEQFNDSIAIPIHCYYEAPPWREYFSDSISGTLMSGDLREGGFTPDNHGSSVLYELYSNRSISIDSVTAALENFTSVVSNYLRTVDDLLLNTAFESSWNHPVVSEAFTQQTCIYVRWQWLTLPIALLVATLIFFGALVVQNAGERGYGVWKSSQNALLWHGLEGLAEQEAPDLETLKEMDRRAKELTVQLGRSNRGWKLIQYS